MSFHETEEQKAARKARNRRLFDLRTNLQSVERQMTKYTEKKNSLEEQINTADGSADDMKRWKDVWSAGQGVGSVDRVCPLAEVVEQLAHEYRAACARG